MDTFYQHIEEIKTAHKISAAAHVASLKRWYALGAKKIRAALLREVAKETIYTDVEANEDSYQLPVYADRLFGIRYNQPGNDYPLEEVASGRRWQELKSGGVVGPPTHYHPAGDNEFEVWPKPSEDVADGLEVNCSFKQPQLIANDVSAGTCTVTNGGQTVTFSQAIVTSAMVGRWFKTTDGSHEYWYRVVNFNNSQSFDLENYYDGESGSGRTFLIGERVDIPEQFLDLVEEFVIAKYTKIYRKNYRLAKSMMDDFEEQVKSLREDYASPGKGGVVSPRRHYVDTRSWKFRTPSGLS